MGPPFVRDVAVPYIADSCLAGACARFGEAAHTKNKPVPITPPILREAIIGKLGAEILCTTTTPDHGNMPILQLALELDLWTTKGGVLDRVVIAVLGISNLLG